MDLVVDPNIVSSGMIVWNHWIYSCIKKKNVTLTLVEVLRGWFMFTVALSYSDKDQCEMWSCTFNLEIEEEMFIL